MRAEGKTRHSDENGEDCEELQVADKISPIPEVGQFKIYRAQGRMEERYASIATGQAHNKPDLREGQCSIAHSDRWLHTRWHQVQKGPETRALP